MKETKKIKRRRRVARREPAFTSKTISIPIYVASAVEEKAGVDFEGNESALITEAVIKFLGIRPATEFVLT